MSAKATALIGFLGRGPYSQGGRGNYRATRYQFPDGWTSPPATFFSSAVLGWMKVRNRSLTQLVLLGTSGSMWDNLLLTLGAQSDEPWVEELIARVDRERIEPGDLDKISSALSNTLEIEVVLELIEPGRDLKEQAAILEALKKHVVEGSRVYLDVTHGYRHQPMLALGAAVLLSRLRGTEIKEIFYGAGDMNLSATDIKPVISLRWLLDLFDWADSVSQLRVGGRLRALHDLVPDETLRNHLSDTGFFVSTNQVGRAGESAEMGIRTLESSSRGDPLFALVAPEIREALNAIDGCRRNSRDMLNLARFAFGHEQYAHAAILLNEAVLKCNRISSDDDTARSIKKLRDALAHAAFSNLPDVVEAMGSRKRMRSLLMEFFKWVEERLPGDGDPS